MTQIKPKKSLNNGILRKVFMQKFGFLEKIISNEQQLKLFKDN